MVTSRCMSDLQQVCGQLRHHCCRSTGDLRGEGGCGSRKQRSKPPARVALFRHVRFNRVHMSITYKGNYFSLNNAKVLAKMDAGGDAANICEALGSTPPMCVTMR